MGPAMGIPATSPRGEEPMRPRGSMLPSPPRWDSCFTMPPGNPCPREPWALNPAAAICCCCWAAGLVMKLKLMPGKSMDACGGCCGGGCMRLSNTDPACMD